jgi:hypothetical protein
MKRDRGGDRDRGRDRGRDRERDRGKGRMLPGRIDVLVDCFESSDV